MAERAQSDFTDPEERIFTAALLVFARKGKDGARMQEIADLAGINKAMLHYYFRSKDLLYAAVFGYVLRRFIVSFGESMQEPAPYADVLRTFIDRYTEFVRHNQDVLHLMVNELLSGGATLKQQLRGVLSAEVSPPPIQFMQRTAQAVAAGEIRPVDPQQTLVTIIAGCAFHFVFFPMMTSINPALESGRDAFIEARKAHLFDILYRGLQPDVTP